MADSQKELVEFKRLYDKYVKHHDEKSRDKKQAAMGRKEQSLRGTEDDDFGEYFRVMEYPE